eukprot:gene224-15946_t
MFCQDSGDLWAGSRPSGKGGVRHPLAPPQLATIPGGCRSSSGGTSSNGRTSNRTSTSTSMLLLLTEPHFNPADGGLLGSQQILGIQTSCDRGRTWSNYQQLAGSADNVHLSYMSAFSDSATNQLHITSRTGVTAEGKPSTVISTAYYRIPFQRLLKGSTLQPTCQDV